jgi:flagellar basal body-associated protein FliL
MPEEAKDKKDGQDAPRKGGLSMKAVIIVGAVLLIEGVTIAGVFLLAGGPDDANANTAAVDEAAQMELPDEVQVIEDKFQNTRTGRAYIYDTQIVVICKRKNKAEIEQKLEMMRARISADIAEIIRKAEPAHLLEPELATLKRQVQSALDSRLGSDIDGNPLVMEVVIPKCEQYRADL